MQQTTTRLLFPLGQVLATPGALSLLAERGMEARFQLRELLVHVSSPSF